MPHLRLHFSHGQQPDHPLPPGVHRLVRQASGGVGVGDAIAGVPLARFRRDRRGLWLEVDEASAGIHVNGRPVRCMALLRAGDAVYADGVELWVRGEPPSPASSSPPAQDHAEDMRVVLRGVGGPHHGRSYTLGPPRLVGSAREADIRIEAPGLAGRHARFERSGERVILHGLAREGIAVNGVPVRDALLSAGDQVAFAGQHRFVVEFPTVAGALPPFLDAPEASAEEPAPATPIQRPVSGSRLPWLLLAALLLGGGLGALLWFGAR